MILFKNAQIIDGSGKKKFKSDVLVDKDRILKVAENIAAEAETVDASDKILCPGFIDVHAHSELECLRDNSMKHKVMQGITTDLSGNCGVGIFPRRENDEPCFADILGHCNTWYWTDFDSYRRGVKCGINMAHLANHAMLRKYAIKGNPNRKATKEEVAIMCSELDKALNQGCFGFSSGIYYAPNVFADSYEFIELLKVVKKHNSIFCVHHRCEGDLLVESIDEVLSYVRATGARCEISHLKAIGISNAPKVDQVLEKIHKMNREGFDIKFDQYPYSYGSTSLFSLLPPRLLRFEQPDLLKELRDTLENPEKKKKLIEEIENPDGWDSIIQLCGFDRITAVILESSPEFNGLKLSQCAEKLNTDPYTALFTLLSRETKCALMIDEYETQETLKKIMKDELMSFGTDALYAGSGAHPRSGNAAIKLLSDYVYGNNTLTEEDAIYRMTGKNAEKFGIKERGFIKEGYKADIVIYDPKSLKDNSRADKPYTRCTGLENVMVNGVFAIKNGEFTSSVSGEVLVS